MKQLIIALAIGVLTIGVSIFVLSDKDETYESDAKVDPTVSLGDLYEGENYNLRMNSFDCDTYASIDKKEQKYGCILDVNLTNTTIFDQILNLDGDTAVSETGNVYESSDELSRQFVPDNELTSEVKVDETVNGGVFFDVPESERIVEVQVFESSISEPIRLELE